MTRISLTLHAATHIFTLVSGVLELSSAFCIRETSTNNDLLTVYSCLIHHILEQQRSMNYLQLIYVRFDRLNRVQLEQHSEHNTCNWKTLPLLKPTRPKPLRQPKHLPNTTRDYYNWWHQVGFQRARAAGTPFNCK